MKLNYLNHTINQQILRIHLYSVDSKLPPSFTHIFTKIPIKTCKPRIFFLPLHLEIEILWKKRDIHQ